MRNNEKPKWEPTPEEIARECELIRAEKLAEDADKRLVGGIAKVWHVPVVRTRSVPPMMPRSDYQ